MGMNLKINTNAISNTAPVPEQPVSTLPAKTINIRNLERGQIADYLE